MSTKKTLVVMTRMSPAALDWLDEVRRVVRRQTGRSVARALLIGTAVQMAMRNGALTREILRRIGES